MTPVIESGRAGGIAVIIPASIQVPAILEAMRANLRSLRHDAVGRIIVVCNRLTLMSAASLEHLLSTDVPYPLQVLHDAERSVAGAWNYGIETARGGGMPQYLITAIDVTFEEFTISHLIEFGERHPEVDVWSSTAADSPGGSAAECRDAYDFSCVMLRSRTIDKYGWFDREFKPAYFEDSDYVTRVVLGGGRPKQVRLAQHQHQRSLTIRRDPDIAHHVRSWFHANAMRFASKWKLKTDDYAEILRQCFASPFDSGRPLHWWPEQARAGYSPSGGIHA